MKATRDKDAPLRRLARHLALLALLLGELGARTARASEASEVVWQDEWPRFRLSEAAVTAGLLGGIAGVVFALPPPREPTIEQTNVFDEFARGGLRLHSRSTRHSAAEISDKLYYGLAIYPLVVDVPVALAVHRSSDVALQLALMDAEALSLTGLVSLAAEKLGRARPMSRECPRDPSYDYKCNDPERLNLSFMSGHTAVSFTSAGLICVHHEHLPLYGGGIGDTIACVTGLAAAASAATLRVMSDNHYASDVLLGSALGFASGYLLPTLLHYGFSGERQKPRALEPRFRAEPFGVAVSGAVLPVVAPEYAGIAVVGVAE